MTRTRVSRGARRAAAVTFLSAALVTGCLSEGSCSVGTSRGGAPDLSIGSMFGVSEASASCAAGVEYQGRFYVAWSDKLPVAKGDLLGAPERRPGGPLPLCRWHLAHPCSFPTRYWLATGRGLRLLASLLRIGGRCGRPGTGWLPTRTLRPGHRGRRGCALGRPLRLGSSA